MSSMIPRLSRIEETLALHMRAMGLPIPEREYKFCSRKWRFDFAYPALKIAIECEGGAGTGGRHTREEGFQQDCYKYNAASMNGWTVLRFTWGMVRSGDAVDMISYLLKQKGYHVADANKMIEQKAGQQTKLTCKERRTAPHTSDN